ncbi:uncharacterized protein PHALS_15362 [Plasmopara halstedii]|uniref:Uncharacterized protein n=1 Tax=Plasmopara halstedii TaxID=4781 RepID=A0A0N7L4N8_PLAHL|nr:uncharacterized protein PHALS_15362 [Plasmopara halstedii]CEG39195.1 hypothetical protein PHALS_15362 [Plasmopara halstedii]|eukprot:XP_024575564.1 hypothetical protein PHALS_15362 [Plasmopara halstedii]
MYAANFAFPHFSECAKSAYPIMKKYDGFIHIESSFLEAHRHMEKNCKDLTLDFIYFKQNIEADSIFVETL